MTSTSRATPGFERCERPSRAPESAAGDQPGRLAQGPDEKHGLAGRRVGFVIPPFLASRPAAGPRISGGPEARRWTGEGQCRRSKRATMYPWRVARNLNCNRKPTRIGSLKDREADSAGLPRLAHLLLDGEPRGGHRRVGPARRIGMRAADRADEVIDERFIAPMPDFEETAGGAQFVHVSSRG